MRNVAAVFQCQPSMSGVAGLDRLAAAVVREDNYDRSCEPVGVDINRGGVAVIKSRVNYQIVESIEASTNPSGQRSNPSDRTIVQRRCT